MKIVFFGTPHLAAEILKKLMESGHEVIAAVTQPDRVSGRGKQVRFSPVKEVAAGAGIPVLQPEKVGDEEALGEIESLGADLHVVAAYAQKLPNRLLEMAPKGCINVHPSLLPKYRGAAPMMAAILNGDKISGVTIMKMAEKMDAGDILLQREMPLDPDETNVSIEEKAIALGSELLLETIEGIEKGTITPIPQDESQSTYVRQMGKEAGQINWQEDAELIERKCRAYDPWPGTYTYLEGKTFKVCKAEVESAPDGAGQKSFTSSQPSLAAMWRAEAGTVSYVDKKAMYVECGTGCLKLLEVQLEGKRRMTTEEFLRGKKIVIGTRLG